MDMITLAMAKSYTDQKVAGGGSGGSSASCVNLADYGIDPMVFVMALEGDGAEMEATAEQITSISEALLSGANIVLETIQDDGDGEYCMRQMIVPLMVTGNAGMFQIYFETLILQRGGMVMGMMYSEEGQIFIVPMEPA